MVSLAALVVVIFLLRPQIVGDLKAIWKWIMDWWFGSNDSPR